MKDDWKFVALNKRVLVQEEAPVGVSKGGIIIPEAAQEKPVMGKVEAVSEGSELEIGDWVIFGKYAGTAIKFNDTVYRVMAEEELFGKFTVPE